MRLCILTRADLFPANHGAAVKIVQTAINMATSLRQPCFIVTSDRDFYWRVDGTIEKCVIDNKSRSAQEWAFFPFLSQFAERLCRFVGYPEEEYFLYSPQFDPAWLMRAVAVGLREDIDIFQAEFPGYGPVAALASRIISILKVGKYPISSIVQHNVEWDRLKEFGHDVKRIRQLEILALKMVHDVIAVSQDDKERMIAAGIDAEKITVIPHGVDCTVMRDGIHRREYWRAHWKISKEETVLFFHGTLHYWPNTEAVRFIAERLIPLLEKLLLY